MCVPGCSAVVQETISRRGFLKAGAALGGVGLTGAAGQAAPPTVQSAPAAGPVPAFSRVIDLTHTHDDRFPNYMGGRAHVAYEPAMSLAVGQGWNLGRWTLDEHAGTHIDAPIHRSVAGLTVDRIAADDLVLPLAIVDLRDRARQEPDTQLTPADLAAWRERHGDLPARCCVAMLSGWDAHVATARYIGIDDAGRRHFPAFHAEAVDWLLRETTARAIAVDTASLDHGPSTDFGVHTRWLGANRWGLENVTGLQHLPPRGATLVCGAPKIAGASGGHSRVLALV